MDLVPDADFARLDDFPVDAAEVEVAGRWRSGETGGILTEAGSEFFAAVVRERCHFDNGLADTEARACGEVFGRDVEIDDEIVAGGGEGLAIGDEFRDIAANHRDLGIEFAGATLPFIAGDTVVDREVDHLDGFVDTGRAAADDHGDAAGVFGKLRERLQARFQFGE